MDALILGASGGIGRAFLTHLLEQGTHPTIHATFNRHQPEISDPRVLWHQVNVQEEHDIESLCNQLGDIALCINAVGFLHNQDYQPEKSTRQIDPEYFIDSMRVNAMPTLLLAKHIVPRLKHKQPAVFATVSARVGSIEENYLGGWYSYRASKAALNMLLKTLSIEWKRSLPNVAVAALHPGTTDTALSKPFQKHVPEGHLFEPTTSVDYMMGVINKLTPADSGKFWSFDGEILPW